ncbi:MULTISPECIES: hypothetical protein [Flammeovirga]|uniref:FeoB-associated Cys-rich membrane protein n=1 Tax=Flammeovirga aprica JL-4 TaxID=694437 RepID=A0A7X9RRG2_9BACT|nr:MULTISPECIES: hypothetical protein [Flammeovirga]MBD0401758.1 hypothetical protein [Flammeovirga sp. EKP202]NME67833.1 hypothetical protein [Flammeovirga aprica JL-4]
MLIKYFTALLILVVILVAWIVVQSLWGQLFKEELNDEDVLKHRSQCGSCSCGAVCKKQFKKANV